MQPHQRVLPNIDIFASMYMPRGRSQGVAVANDQDVASTAVEPERVHTLLRDRLKHAANALRQTFQTQHR
eukprot:2727507-Rhodomonas_salina.5